MPDKRNITFLTHCDLCDAHYPVGWSHRCGETKGNGYTRTETPLEEIAGLLMSARADILQGNPAAATASVAVALDEIAKLEDQELRK